MKRSIEALVVVPMLLVIVAMAILGLYGIARAEPVEQFGFQVSGSSPAQLALHLMLRSFDTTGAVPQTPTARELRLPAGVRLNASFLGARYQCDAGALRDALDARPTGVLFNSARLRGGRCVRRRTDASLFELPRCPALGRFSVQLRTAYPPPTLSRTTTLEVPCPAYLS